MVCCKFRLRGFLKIGIHINKNIAKFDVFLMTPALQLHDSNTPKHIHIFHEFNLFVIMKFPVWPLIHKFCVFSGTGRLPAAHAW